MRVILVFPSSRGHYKNTKLEGSIETQVPLGLATIAGALERAGHQVKIIDLDVESEGLNAIAKTIGSFDPQICGVTFKTPFFNEAKKIAEFVKNIDPEIIMVAGGVHPSIYPEDVLEKTMMDVVVIGEGDFTVVDLASGMDFEQIKGIAYKRNGIIKVNRKEFHEGKKSSGYIQDLDTLAFPAWHLLDLSKYGGISPLLHRGNPVGFIETSRGCLAKCVFCTKGVFGATFRVKSPKRAVDEMQYVAECGFKEFSIIDDSFTTQIDRAVAVCEEMMKRKVQVPWNCINGLRVANVTEDFFKIASRAGLHLIAFGYESGSQDILTRIKKGATVEQARKTTKWAKKYGITIVGYFMLGLPGETEKTMQETIDFARSLDIDYAKFDITIPLPGTELYYLWKDKIKTDSWMDFNYHTTARNLYDHPDLDWDLIEGYIKKAYKKFYFRPSYIMKRLLRSFEEKKLMLTIKTSLSVKW